MKKRAKLWIVVLCVCIDFFGIMWVLDKTMGLVSVILSFV